MIPAPAKPLFLSGHIGYMILRYFFTAIHQPTAVHYRPQVNRPPCYHPNSALCISSEQCVGNQPIPATCKKHPNESRRKQC